MLYEIGIALQRNLEPCRKCFTKPYFEDRCVNYGRTLDFRIWCEHCNAGIEADASHLRFGCYEERISLCRTLAETWNAENSLKIILTPHFEPPSFAISVIRSLIR